MSDIFVAMAGTPEASSADYVCDGIDDDVEIAAAIAAAGSLGGATVHLGAGVYSVSAPIVVLDDNIHLTGAGGGLTTLQAASDWQSQVHPNGAHLAGMVSFCAVDNFSASGLTVDAATNGIHCNGIIAIPDGPDGAGKVCTNGAIAGNEVFLIQAHDYSIWSLRGEHISITDNLVDGGSTPTSDSPHQEGIEIYGGNDVTISGNTVRNIGGSAFNIGGLADATPDCSVENLQLVGNVVANARIGISLGTTFGPQTGAVADLRNISIANNELTHITEFGFQLKNWTGSVDTPPTVENLSITNNRVNMAVVQEGFGAAASGFWFHNATGLGETRFIDIEISGNSFRQTQADDVFPAFYLPPVSPGHIYFFQAEGFSFSGNEVLDEDPKADSYAVVAHYSRNFSIDTNEISGAGRNAVYVYGSSDVLIRSNQVSDWNAGSWSSAALIVENTTAAQVHDNEFSTAYAVEAPTVFIISPSPGTDAVSGNVYISEIDVRLIDNLTEGLRLIGSAVAATGNSVDNQIVGNELDNVLDGLGGDDILDGRAGDDDLQGGVGNDWLIGGAGADRLDGGDGVDHAGYDTAAAAVRVDLVNPGANVGDAAGDSFISIEELRGSSFNDVLLGEVGSQSLLGLGGNDYLDGREGDDVVQGGDGNDRLSGGAGADILDGGNGYDYARYEAATRAVVLDLMNPAVNTGDAAGDTFVSIEGVVGSSSADTISGSDGSNDLVGLSGDDYIYGRGGNDGLQGGAGNDWLIGGSGADRLDGGDGFDYASHHTAAAGVTVDLINPAVNTGDAAGDTFVSIEGLVGSSSADTISGNDGSNDLVGLSGGDHIYGRGGNDGLQGGAGNDWLIGGPGADRLDGGDGFDYASYHTAAAGVTVDLINPVVNTGDAAGDTFVSIEGVVGSSSADTISGNDGSNDLVGLSGDDHIYGRGGNDGLQGGAGNDWLIGGPGADRLDGGDGFDYASYHTAAAGVTVDLINPAVNTGDTAGDTFVSIEGLVGSSTADTISGNDGSNDLVGLSGDDHIYGRGGNDGLQGGAGNDWLSGGAGNDHLIGGEGADTFVFDTAPDASNVDIISDFASAVDHIGLVATGAYAGMPLGELAVEALHIVGGTDPMTADTRIVYDPATGALYFDADGSGSELALKFAVLSNLPGTLQAGDIVVIGTDPG
ncbi:MAG TPA: calcium-binding protein [Lysobacter sp.]|jgi:Ca2+-binding RTX toxin-like protein|nr:calcium-binding protein [Lysobacter sp.]